MLTWYKVLNFQHFKSCRKPSILDASKLLDVPHGKFGFTKGCIIDVILLSLSRTLNRGQPNLECFEFWLPTSQLLVLYMCLRDAFA
ncbi:DUF645 family protein [Vibrio mimicus]